MLASVIESHIITLASYSVESKALLFPIIILFLLNTTIIIVDRHFAATSCVDQNSKYRRAPTCRIIMPRKHTISLLYILKPLRICILSTDTYVHTYDNRS